MLQILFDHFISHLPNRGTKIAPSPKMPSPVPLLQVRKFLEHIARSPSFDSPHDFTGCHIRRCADQNMDAIFAHHASDNPNFKSFACLPYQVSNSFRYLSLQNFVAIFGNPNKMVFNLVTVWLPYL